MTLTEAVIAINRMQEKFIVGDKPDIETFSSLDFIKKQIMDSQGAKKKWSKSKVKTIKPHCKCQTPKEQENRRDCGICGEMII